MRKLSGDRPPGIHCSGRVGGVGAVTSVGDVCVVGVAGAVAGVGGAGHVVGGGGSGGREGMSGEGMSGEAVVGCLGGGVAVVQVQPRAPNRAFIYTSAPPDLARARSSGGRSYFSGFFFLAPQILPGGRRKEGGVVEISLA